MFRCANDGSNDLDSEESRKRIWTICLVVLSTIAVTYAIFWLRPVLVPAVVAVFVVSGVSPILKVFQDKLGVTRLVAAALTFLAGAVVLVIFGCSLFISVVEVADNAEAYRNRVRVLARKVESQLPIKLLSPDASEVESEASPETNQEISKYVDAFIRDGITVVSQTFISLVSTSVVVLIYVFFLLLGSPPEFNRSGTWHEVENQIRSYLSLKTVISIFTGAAFGLTLRLFGVPMAMTFGVLAFLLNFIPNVGPLVASLLPIPLIILDPEGSLGWMIAVISVTSGIQLISGNIVEPKVMGGSADLHPVTILLALMFWGMMWGIVGMFLATPIMAGLKIVLERINGTKPIAELMAGRLPQEPLFG